jgi:hypothetical protein
MLSARHTPIPRDALADIETPDAAYGVVPPELFARAQKLR